MSSELDPFSQYTLPSKPSSKEVSFCEPEEEPFSYCTSLFSFPHIRVYSLSKSSYASDEPLPDEKSKDDLPIEQQALLGCVQIKDGKKERLAYRIQYTTLPSEKKLKAQKIALHLLSLTPENRDIFLQKMRASLFDPREPGIDLHKIRPTDLSKLTWY